MLYIPVLWYWNSFFSNHNCTKMYIIVYIFVSFPEFLSNKNSLGREREKEWEKSKQPSAIRMLVVNSKKNQLILVIIQNGKSDFWRLAQWIHDVETFRLWIWEQKCIPHYTFMSFSQISKNYWTNANDLARPNELTMQNTWTVLFSAF